MKNDDMFVVIDGKITIRKIDHYERDILNDTSTSDVSGPSSLKPIPVLHEGEELSEVVNNYPIIIRKG